LTGNILQIPGVSKFSQRRAKLFQGSFARGTGAFRIIEARAMRIPLGLRDSEVCAAESCRGVTILYRFGGDGSEIVQAFHHYLLAISERDKTAAEEIAIFDRVILAELRQVPPEFKYLRRGLGGGKTFFCLQFQFLG
jgi:hypothetical protein